MLKAAAAARMIASRKRLAMSTTVSASGSSSTSRSPARALPMKAMGIDTSTVRRTITPTASAMSAKPQGVRWGSAGVTGAVGVARSYSGMRPVYGRGRSKGQGTRSREQERRRTVEPCRSMLHTGGVDEDAASSWDARYRGDEAIPERGPARFLGENLDLLPGRGTALDAAMGTGRNALFLAELRYQVTGIDISPVAVERGRGEASRRGVQLEAS